MMSAQERDMKRVYILMHNNWPVAVYENKEEAEKQEQKYWKYVLNTTGPGEGCGHVDVITATLNKEFDSGRSR
jgi:hypothetical protein